MTSSPPRRSPLLMTSSPLRRSPSPTPSSFNEHAIPYCKYVPVKVNGIRTSALVDSGNSYFSCCSYSFLQRLGYSKKDLYPLKQNVTTAAKNVTIKPLGQLKGRLRLRLGGLQKEFLIRPIVFDQLSMDYNISGPFLKANNIDQLHTQDCLLYKGIRIPLYAKPHDIPAISSVQQPLSVYTLHTQRLSAHTRSPIPVRVPALESTSSPPRTGVFSLSTRLSSDYQLDDIPQSSVFTDASGNTSIYLTNYTNDPITLPKGFRVGTVSFDPIHLASLDTWERQHSPSTFINPLLDSAHPSLLSLDAPPSSSPPVQPWPLTRKRQWLLEQFRLKDAHYLKDQPAKINRVLQVLLKHWPVFDPEGPFLATDLIEHRIITQDVPPIAEKIRPINPHVEKDLRKQIQYWLDNGLIVPSQSPWQANIFAVPKKNLQMRHVIDYRRLNSITKVERFPLPNIEDSLARLSTSKIFSNLDAKDAYYTVPIAKEDQDKTSFATPFANYKWTRMPFGLTSAPFTFQRLIAKALQDVPTTVALPFLDDTAIHTRTFDEHVDALDLVLSKFERARLKLQPSKCSLFQDTIEFLGHQVSHNGVSPVKKYLKIVEDWPMCKSPIDVQSYLGKMAYYRKFIRGFSQLAHPLYELCTDKAKEDYKNGKWEFTPEAQKVFHDLKRRLVSAPILALPRFHDLDNNPFILDTDYCQLTNTAGAVLSQKQDGHERVICYGARKLPKSAKNYAPTKGEMAAAIIFLRMFKYYLQGKPFVLRTDHKSLMWLRSMKEPTGMLARWLQVLAEFQFTILHRPGKRHQNADALSRVHHAEPLGPDEQVDDVPGLLVSAIEGDEGGDEGFHIVIQELRAKQEDDENLGLIKKWIQSKYKPESLQIRALSREGQIYADLLPSLCIDHRDLVCLKQTDGSVEELKICVPEALKDPLIRKIHQIGGHQAVQATTYRVQRNLFFPHMKSRVEEVLQGCFPCQQAKPPPKHQRALLVSPQEGFPFRKISIDWVGPMEVSSLGGNKYIFSVKDAFSRWVEFFPTKAATTKIACDLLQKEIFSRYGIPEIIHSDRGSQFMSTQFQNMCAEYHIKHSFTPAWHPQSNTVERVHADLGKILRKMVGNKGHKWEDYLPQASFALRTAVSSVTKLSPFQVLFGHQASQPLDLIFGRPPHEKRSFAPTQQYAKELRERIDACHKYVRENISAAVRRERRRYHQHYKKFSIGSKVWLFTPAIKPGSSRKLSSLWTGLWTITKQINPLMFEIAPDPSWPKQEKHSVSIDRLRSASDTDVLRSCPPSSHHDIDMTDDPFATNIALGLAPPVGSRHDTVALPHPPGTPPPPGGGGGGGGFPPPAPPRPPPAPHPPPPVPPVPPASPPQHPSPRPPPSPRPLIAPSPPRPLIAPLPRPQFSPPPRGTIRPYRFPLSPGFDTTFPSPPPLSRHLTTQSPHIARIPLPFPPSSPRPASPVSPPRQSPSQAPPRYASPLPSASPRFVTPRSHPSPSSSISSHPSPFSDYDADPSWQPYPALRCNVASRYNLRSRPTRPSPSSVQTPNEQPASPRSICTPRPARAGQRHQRSLSTDRPCPSDNSKQPNNCSPCNNSNRSPRRPHSLSPNGRHLPLPNPSQLSHPTSPPLPRESFSSQHPRSPPLFPQTPVSFPTRPSPNTTPLSPLRSRFSPRPQFPSAPLPSPNNRTRETTSSRATSDDRPAMPRVCSSPTNSHAHPRTTGPTRFLSTPLFRLSSPRPHVPSPNHSCPPHRPLSSLPDTTPLSHLPSNPRLTRPSSPSAPSVPRANLFSQFKWSSLFPPIPRHSNGSRTTTSAPVAPSSSHALPSSSSPASHVSFPITSQPRTDSTSPFSLCPTVTTATSVPTHTASSTLSTTTSSPSLPSSSSPAQPFSQSARSFSPSRQLPQSPTVPPPSPGLLPSRPTRSTSPASHPSSPS